jgi:hypothetical protein
MHCTLRGGGGGRVVSHDVFPLSSIFQCFILICIVQWVPNMALLVVEPDHLPDSEVCFSHAWTPFPNRGCGGDFPPTTVSRGGKIL